MSNVFLKVLLEFSELNNSNGGSDWREHGVTKEQVYGRQSKTKLGSERLYEVTDKLIQENINKGNIKAE